MEDSELSNIHVKSCCEPVVKKTTAERAAAKAQAKFERRTQLSKAAANLLRGLKYTVPDEPVSVQKEEPEFKQGLSFHVDELPLTPGIMAKYRIYDDGGNWWILESKVVFSVADAQLSATDLDAVAAIAARFAPPGSTVSLQADTHGAGNVFVGMIMSVDVTGCRIPVNLVSGDIGCGLSVIPLVNSSISQVCADIATRDYFAHTWLQPCDERCYGAKLQKAVHFLHPM